MVGATKLRFLGDIFGENEVIKDMSFIGRAHNDYKNDIKMLFMSYLIHKKWSIKIDK